MNNANQTPAEAKDYKQSELFDVNNALDPAKNEEPKATSKEDELVACNATINAAFDRLDDDISGMYSNEVMGALVTLESSDLQAYEALMHSLKKYRIASEVRGRVKQFARSLFKQKKASVLEFPDKSVGSVNYSRKSPKAGFLVDYDVYVGKSVVVAESEAALLMAEYLTGRLAYCDSSLTWHRYDGTHWEPLSIEGEANKVLLKLIYLGTKPLGFKNNYRNNIKSLISDGGMLPMPEIQRELIPFQNGLLNTKTGELIKSTPHNSQSWVLPYEYNQTAECPRIKQWLGLAVDYDGGMVQLLRAWFAALLHGRTDLQKFLHLLGRGGTGKGTFFRLAKAMIGEHNTATTTLKTMENNAFETANFFGKRLIVITDSDKYNGSVNILKSITGQDPIRLERKYQQAGHFTCEALVIIASNENLVTTDHTSGIERRRSTVRFDNVFSEDEKLTWEKMGGESVLHAELPGFINWLLELSPDDIGQIIRKPPHKALEANFDAMTAGNPLAEWLTECCIPDKEYWSQIGVKIESKDPGYEVEYEKNKEWLYANYLQWSLRNNRKPHSIRRFREITIDTAKTLGVEVSESRRSDGMGVSGIRLCKGWENALSQWKKG